MTTEEFSNEFDIATNAYLPNGELFDEYEKSVFLTKAQEQIVLQLYNSFEKREFTKEILAPLIKTFVAKDEFTGVNENGEIETELYPISDNSYFYKLPDDLWLITFEEAVIDSKDKCLNNKRISVSPTTQDKLIKILKNPFKGPNENRALRLNIANNIVEIITKYDIRRYYIRYIKKLSPIILTKLTDTTSLSGIVDRTECELHESIHRDILNMAVALALQNRRLTAQPQQQSQQTPQEQQE